MFLNVAKELHHVEQFLSQNMRILPMFNYCKKFQNMKNKINILWTLLIQFAILMLSLLSRTIKPLHLSDGLTMMSFFFIFVSHVSFYFSV